MNGHVLDRADPMDVSDHASYDIFSSSAQSSQRYRGNSTSSYPLGVDSMYTQSPFSESLPQFHNPSPDPYGLMNNGLPSSYSSGKPSPLTPNDSVGSLQHSSAFPFNHTETKPFHPGNGFDSVRYPSNDYHDEYNGININSNLGLNGFSSSSTLPPFGRMQQDSRYPGPVIPPLSIPSHLHPNQSPDPMHGVNPSAMHDNFPSFLASETGLQHFPLRMGMEDPLARRLNGGGAATDLQTFIRSVRTIRCC